MTARLCPWPDCETLIPSDRFMCRDHWYRLPRAVRSEVWSAWRRFLDGELGPDQLRAVQAQAIDYAIASSK